MTYLNDLIFPSSQDSIEKVARQLNELNPESGISFSSPQYRISLRIKSDSNESLVYHLSQDYVEILKMPHEKENQYFWVNFQHGGHRVFEDPSERHGLHIIGEDGGWSYASIEPFRVSDVSLALPLKNFGKGAVLYLYESP